MWVDKQMRGDIFSFVIVQLRGRRAVPLCSPVVMAVLTAGLRRHPYQPASLCQWPWTTVPQHWPSKRHLYRAFGRVLVPSAVFLRDRTVITHITSFLKGHKIKTALQRVRVSYCEWLTLDHLAGAVHSTVVMLPVRMIFFFCEPFSSSLKCIAPQGTFVLQEWLEMS